MSTRLIPIVASAGVTVYNSDSEDNQNTIVERDSSGNCKIKTVTATVDLKTTGGRSINSVAKSSTFTVDGLATHYVIDSTSGSVTVNLPAASGAAGRFITVKKTVAGNSVIIDGNSSETIDGATTKTATAQYAAAVLWCDGTQWWFQSTIGTWS